MISPICLIEIIIVKRVSLVPTFRWDVRGVRSKLKNIIHPTYVNSLLNQIFLNNIYPNKIKYLNGSARIVTTCVLFTELPSELISSPNIIDSKPFMLLSTESAKSSLSWTSLISIVANAKSSSSEKRLSSPKFNFEN